MNSTLLTKFRMIALLAIVAATATACPPPPPGGDAISVPALGTWAAPTYTLSAQQSNRVITGGNGGTGYDLKVTASQGGATVASFDVTWASSTAPGPNTLSTGTYVAPEIGLTAPRRFTVVDTTKVNGSYSTVAGWIDITDYATGTWSTDGTPGWAAPVTRLRARVHLYFAEPVGWVDGTLSIG